MSLLRVQPDRLTLLYGVSPSRLHNAELIAIHAAWDDADARRRERFRALFGHARPDVDEYFLTLSGHVELWPPALPLPLSARVPWDAPPDFMKASRLLPDDNGDPLCAFKDTLYHKFGKAPGALPKPGGGRPGAKRSALAQNGTNKTHACIVPGGPGANISAACADNKAEHLSLKAHETGGASDSVFSGVGAHEASADNQKSESGLIQDILHILFVNMVTPE